jgi:hypothetical protein
MRCASLEYTVVRPSNPVVVESTEREPAARSLTTVVLRVAVLPS